MATVDLQHNLIQQRWWHTEIAVSWQDQYKSLPYVHEKFNDPDTQQLWLDRGFIAQRFTGDLFDMRFARPDWVSTICDLFSWSNVCWSVYRMTPGTVLPIHRDTYQRFRSKYNVSCLDEIARCIIFLENWDSGHYFEIDNVPIVGWRQGQGIAWIGDVPHLAANIGQHNRYTLQITGLLSTSDAQNLMVPS